MLSVQDSPGVRGRVDEGQGSLERAVSLGEWGAELGEELTCSRPGSEWDPCEEPSGALGSSAYQCARLGGWARGLCCAP